MTFEQCTIYKAGGMMGNYSKVECRSASIEYGPYAQYNNAVHVRFTPKGARKQRGYVDTNHPTTVVLAGHGHFEPIGMFGEPEVVDGIGTTVAKSVYSSFDKGWDLDFDRMLAEHIEKTGAEVLFDSRKHDASEKQFAVGK